MSRYIDADALKEWLDEYLSVFKKYDKGTIKGFVDHAPTIEPKRGKWIKRKRKCEYRCSECGKIVFADDENELNFCCSCGADMREVRDE